MFDAPAAAEVFVLGIVLGAFLAHCLSFGWVTLAKRSRATHDKQFLAEHAYPVLNATAQYWQGRATARADRSAHTPSFGYEATREWRRGSAKSE